MARVLTRPPSRISDKAPPPGPGGPHEGGGGGGEWALLTVARNHVLAHLIRGRLAQEGIEVVLDASNASPGAWLHPFGDPGSPVRVFVRLTDLSAATLLLHEADQPAEDRPGGDRSGSGRPGFVWPWAAARPGRTESPGVFKTIFRILAAFAAALLLSGLLLFGPCISHWFCV